MSVDACQGRTVPPRDTGSEGHREEGTASVELIAVVPFLLLAVFVAAQVGAVGESLWSAEIAARAGARAALVGGDPNATARRALPTVLRGEARVTDAGDVGVRVGVPRILPLTPPLTVEAESRLDDG
jgi:hypothetical protein